MKRFTETTKWRDPWFRKLSPTAKLLFQWLVDNCDNAGVIDLDLEAASFDIGEPVNENHVAEIESRLNRLSNGKFWAFKFIAFQYGTLSTSGKCVPHLRVIESLKAHGISYPDLEDSSTRVETTLVSRVESTLKDKTRQEKDKTVQDKEGGSGGKDNGELFRRDQYHKDSRTVLHLLNEGCGKHFREVDKNLGFISARLYEPGVTLDGVRKMITRQCRLWMGTSQQEYLRPETLFNSTKFESYYASNELPISTNAKPGPVKVW